MTQILLTLVLAATAATADVPTSRGKYIVRVKAEARGRSVRDIEALAADSSRLESLANRAKGDALGSRLAGRLFLLSNATTATAEALLRNPMIESVTPSVPGSLDGLRIHNSPYSPGGVQVLSNGLDRIDQRAPRNAITSGLQRYADPRTGFGQTVWLVDDAVLTSHVDFVQSSGFPRSVTNIYDATNGLCTGLQTSHGTGMASIIGGRWSGVAANVSINAIDVTCENGVVFPESVIRALTYLIDLHGSLQTCDMQDVENWGPYLPFQIVNMSLTVPFNQNINDLVQELESTCERFVVVAAAGNHAASASNYSPASAYAAHAIGNVNSSNTFDSWAPDSNFGPKVDLLAPGVDIFAADSLDPGSMQQTATTRYSSGSGTSASAAIVSGSLARHFELISPSQFWWISDLWMEFAYHATSANVMNLPAHTTNNVAFVDYMPPRTKAATRLTQSARADSINTVLTDANGSSYAGGQANSGTNVYPCVLGGSEGFVRKTSVSGSQLWTAVFRQGTCASSSQPEHNVAVTSIATNGSALYAGYNVSNYWFTSPVFASGRLVRLDPSTGAILWTVGIGSTSTSVWSVSVDTLNNAYVAGVTTESLFGTTSAGGTDAFVAKYNSQGTQLWFRRLGTAGDDLLTTSTCGTGELVAGGFTSGLLSGAKDLDNTAVLANIGGNDAIIVRYDSQGVIKNSVQFGTTGNDAVRSLKYGARLGFIGTVGGSFSSPIIGPGGGQDIVFGLLNTGSANSLPAIWVKQMGSNADDDAQNFDLDELSRTAVVIGGYWRGTGAWLGTGWIPQNKSFLAKFSTVGEQRWIWFADADANSNWIRDVSFVPVFGSGTADIVIGGTVGPGSWPAAGNKQDGVLLRIEGT